MIVLIILLFTISIDRVTNISDRAYADLNLDSVDTESTEVSDSQFSTHVIIYDLMIT